MSTDLIPLAFPLTGSRLIEASAGTGKTWTIAALYVRLVLGHGGEQAFARPLVPGEILVMTFTRAATKELCARVRARLVASAAAFRAGAAPEADPFLQALLLDYPDAQSRCHAAHRLANAAEAMDDAAIFTIDAWCQRMLREHAFDSGCLFDETLVASEETVLCDAVRDYWRSHVYTLDAASLRHLRDCWNSLPDMNAAIKPLVARAERFAPSGPTLAECIASVRAGQIATAAALKVGQGAAVDAMEAWIAGHRKDLNGTRLRAATVAACFAAMRAWIADPEHVQPDEAFAKGCDKLDPAFLCEVHKDKSVTPPPAFAALGVLRDALAAIEPLAHAIKRHAASAVASRVAQIKARRREFGFADLLVRLRVALEGPNAAALRERIVAQYPVAMIDEFQDTAPDQYRIFDALYRVAQNDPNTALLLIGDPKQAIYGFRGADIHNYLAARRATAGRHYRLGTNYRSTGAMVDAVNHLFGHAEARKEPAGQAGAAFRFRQGPDNPLPFEAVNAYGRAETLVGHCPAGSALTLWCHDADTGTVDGYRRHYAGVCAQHITDLLNDPHVGFVEDGGFTLLEPADIAILVRNRTEAASVRRALDERGVASVFLSDKDSVFNSEEAADLLRWLRAVASPMDAALARIAYATGTAGLSLARLAHLASDDLAWEGCVEQLKLLRGIWQRQGVLAMLRRLLHELDLPARLMATPGGERRLTNLLHLAEMVQAASGQLDGEQAVIRWLAGELDHDGQSSEEAILRLESDDRLVKIITVHKAKGLEYALVYVPFAVTARKTSRRTEKFFEYTDQHGQRQIDLARSDAGMAAMDGQRLEEDIRVLYVAATRARHALWLGVMSINDTVHESGFGYLLAGAQPVPGSALPQALDALAKGCASMTVAPVSAPAPFAPLARRRSGAPLVNVTAYHAQFERNWSISSYTAMTRELGAPAAPGTPAQEKLLGDEPNAGAAASRGAVWHRFPRGPLPGQFLHEQLEWLATEGFGVLETPDGVTRFRQRLARAGWEHRAEDTQEWLEAVLACTLAPLGCRLGGLSQTVPEMEFWVPAFTMRTEALDRLCQQRLLDGRERPALQPRALNGMVRGFMDMVFMHDGAYWVLDYKSNWLGKDDAAYNREGLMAGMAAHRYDVQGTIYLHALHRLLQARLGSAYDPARHLGGVLFFFLRGVGNAATQGCFHLAPDPGLLTALDDLLQAPPAGAAHREAA